MLTERDKLEQEALKLLEKGQTDRALERYQALLKADPRDRRVRQKVAELLLKLGRAPEAERHLREIVKALVSSGQERAAIAVFQQLIKLKSDDPDLRTQMGDAYMASGFPNDARAAYDQAVEMLRIQPAKAVEIQRRIIKLAPGEFPQKVKLAELMEAANWTEAAFQEWRNLSSEAQRLGRPDDRARFLELALRLRPDNVEVKIDAAEARVAMGEARLAVPHLEAAIKVAPGNPRALALLGTAYEKIEQVELARGIWLTVARNLKASGDVVGRADALRHAVACGAADPAITAELSLADQLAERAKLRLDVQDWALPEAEAEVLVVIRAQVQARYGFPDRGRKTLEGAGAVRASSSVRIALAELLAVGGEKGLAVEELKALTVQAQGARDQIATRVAVLEGRLESLALSTPLPKSASPLSIDEGLDDDIIDDELVSGPPGGDKVGDDEIVDDEIVDDEIVDEGGGLLHAIIDDEEIVEDDATDHGGGESALDPWAQRLLDDRKEEVVEDDPTDAGASVDEWDLGSPTGEHPMEPRPEPVWDEDPDVARVEEAAGDAAVAAGRVDESLAAYRRSLAADPSNQEVLLKLGELMGAPRSSRPMPAAPSPPAPVIAAPTAPAAVPFAPPHSALVPFPSLSTPGSARPRTETRPRVLVEPSLDASLSFGSAPDFGEIFGGSRGPLEQEELRLDDPAGSLGTARAWLLLGRGREALSALSAETTLEARLLAARARRQQAELPLATTELAAAVAEAAEDDPSYVEAIFELACLNAATGKLRAAKRLLDELLDLSPEWRPADVAALRRGLELLA